MVRVAGAVIPHGHGILLLLAQEEGKAQHPKAFRRIAEAGLIEETGGEKDVGGQSRKRGVRRCSSSDPGPLG